MNRWNTTLFILGALLAASSQARSQIGPQRTVLGTGAASGTNGAYLVVGTLGQAAIGYVGSTVNVAEHGFWNARPRSAGSPSAQDDPAAAECPLTIRALPNPFTGSTGLCLSIPRADHVTLTLYNQLGQPVRRLLDSALPEGSLKLRLADDGLPSGRYTVALTAGHERRTIALTLVR